MFLLYGISKKKTGKISNVQRPTAEYTGFVDYYAPKCTVLYYWNFSEKKIDWFF